MHALCGAATTTYAGMYTWPSGQTQTPLDNVRNNGDTSQLAN